MPICFCASGCALNPLADPGVFGSSCSCFCHHAVSATCEPEDDDPQLAPLIDAVVERLDPDGRFGDVADEITNKLLPEEMKIAAAGLCVEQTAYGMPWIRYCEQPAAPGALLCEQHRREHIEQYGPHACSGAFLGYHDDEHE